MHKFWEGSPPLARGTGGTEHSEIRGAGITPACAGNRCTYCHKRLRVEDHPRLRGEQLQRARRLYKTLGSPPLARGTARAELSRGHDRGITPACAGNSLDTLYARRASRDHPRLRGEQTMIMAGKLLVSGSPPLARGTAAMPYRWIQAAGITPACAGNRLKKDLLYLVFYNIVFHFSISFS